jgi:hypothetical protein
MAAAAKVAAKVPSAQSGGGWGRVDDDDDMAESSASPLTSAEAATQAVAIPASLMTTPAAVSAVAFKKRDLGGDGSGAAKKKQFRKKGDGEE